MGRYRYRIDPIELEALKEVVMDVVTDDSPTTKQFLAGAVKDRIPAFVESDPYWKDKLSTACQRLKREGKIRLTRLPGGKGRAWRGWLRTNEPR